MSVLRPRRRDGDRKTRATLDMRLQSICLSRQVGSPYTAELALCQSTPVPRSPKRLIGWESSGGSAIALVADQEDHTMRTTSLPFSFLLLLAPLAANAQVPGEPSLEPEARWSLGAGAVTFLVYSNLLSTGQWVLPTASAATASLERRIGSSAWLVLGVSGSLARVRTDQPPSGTWGVTSYDLVGASLLGGLRQVLTPPRAPVDVSLLVLANVGLANVEEHLFDGVAGSSAKVTAWSCGASIGLAIDRELARGITLRVATSLVGAEWSKANTDGAGLAATFLGNSGSDFSAGVEIAPRLELRVAF
jgi:hypothetical protein